MLAPLTRSLSPAFVPSDDVAEGGQLFIRILQVGEGGNVAQVGGHAAQPLRAPEVARALYQQRHQPLAPCAQHRCPPSLSAIHKHILYYL
eukprot:1185688-Prorocentrum_minimum.AAC.1